MAERSLAHRPTVPNERYQLVDAPQVTSERVDSLPLLLAQLERMELPQLLEAHLPTSHHGGPGLGWMGTIWLAALLAHRGPQVEQMQHWAEQHRESLRRCAGQAVQPHDFSDERLGALLAGLADDLAWARFEAALNQRLIALGLDPAPVQLLAEALHEAQQARSTLQSRLMQAQGELAALNQRRRGKFDQLDELRRAAEEIVATHRLEHILQIACEERVVVRSVRRYRGRPGTERTERAVRVTATVDATALTNTAWRMGWWVYAATMPIQTLSMMQTLLAYRSAYLIERGSQQLDPLAAPAGGDRHMAGLARLLTIGVRALALLDGLLQTREIEVGATPGQPLGQLTGEQLLAGFADLTLTIVRDGPRIRYHLTPLSAAQLRLLQRLDLSPEIYVRLSH